MHEIRRSLLLLTLLSIACGGAEPVQTSTPDPEPTGPLLEDPLTRAEALAELESRLGAALSANDGDFTTPEVVAIAHETVADATRAYLNVDDVTYRGHVLEYLVTLHDPRALNAFVAALDVEDSAIEEHAVTAAHALAEIRLPDEVADVAVSALSRRLLAVEDARPVDNRLRVSILRALGFIGRPSAVPAIAQVAIRIDERQSFLINRLAMEQLAEIRHESALDAAIAGLFLFDADDPAVRMNDVALLTLARIGQPAVAPLTALFSGQDSAVRPIVNAYVDAVRAASPDTELGVAQVVASETALVLGTLGDPSAFDALVEATEGDDPDRRVAAALALARLDVPRRQSQRVRTILEAEYRSAPLESKAQLIAAMQRRVDPAHVRFLASVVRDRRAEDVLKRLAFRAAALTVLAEEARAVTRLTPPEGAAEGTMLDVVGRCARDLDCWLGEAASDDSAVLERVAYALGRLAEGEDMRPVTALTDLLRHPEVRVRLAAIAALDRARQGQVGAGVIYDVSVAEAGRPEWQAFAPAAMPAAARFEARAARQQSE